MPTGSRKKYILGTILLLTPTYAAAGNIDTAKVEATWLQRNNELRESLDLEPYTINSRLTTTAQERSDLSVEREKIDHKRKETDGYYNYGGIEDWFADRGVKFKNINRATFSESLGYGYFVCKKEDCTEDLIKAVKSTRTFFMSEQPKMGVHYKALVHPWFQSMGLGVTVDEEAKRYYLTLHYASEVVSPIAVKKMQGLPSLP